MRNDELHMSGLVQSVPLFRVLLPGMLGIGNNPEDEDQINLSRLSHYTIILAALGVPHTPVTQSMNSFMI